MKSPHWLLLLFAGLLGSGCQAPSHAPEIPPFRGLEELDRSVQEQYVRRQAALEEVLHEQSASDREKSRAYGQLGNWFYTYRFDAQAEACYLHSQRLDPDSPRWTYYLAHLYLRMGRPQEAVSFFERVLAARPEFIPALVVLGEHERRAGHLDRAATLFQHATELDPLCTRAWVGLGQIALTRHDLQSAKRLLEKALAQQPRANSIFTPLARAYVELGEEERAESLLRHIPKGNTEQLAPALDDPWMRELNEVRGDVQHFVHAAMNARREKRWHVALENFEQAIAADRQNLRPRLLLARTLIEMGRLEAAEHELREALLLFPSHPQILHSLGSLLALEGRVSEAEPVLRASLESDPNHTAAHLALGRLLQSQDRCEEALVHFARVQSLAPAHTSAAYWRAACLAKLERFVEAIELLDSSLRKNPDQPLIRSLLARLLVTAPGSASRDAGRALELLPSSGLNVHQAESRAMALAAAERFSEAVRWQEASVLAIDGTALPHLCNGDVARERLEQYHEQKKSRKPRASGESLCYLSVVLPTDSPTPP